MRAISWTADYNLRYRLCTPEMEHDKASTSYDGLGEVVHLGSGKQTFKGGPNNDTIFGESGDDWIDGARGADVLRGGSGDDTLLGNQGKDRLYGGSGDDDLSGNGGRAEFWAGKGADLLGLDVGERDIIHYSSVSQSSLAQGIDFVTPFQPGEDILDLHRIDADISTREDEAFQFIGDAPFSQTAGELRRGGEFLYGDVDGDGTADFVLRISTFDLVTDADILN